MINTVETLLITYCPTYLLELYKQRWEIMHRNNALVTYETEPPYAYMDIVAELERRNGK